VSLQSYPFLAIRSAPGPTGSLLSDVYSTYPSRLFFPLEESCRPLILTSPCLKTAMLRARYKGFGPVPPARSTSHDRVSPFLILHFGWEFLTSQEKSLLCSLHPAICSYSRLHLVASSAAIHHLLEPCPAPAPDKPTDKTRLAHMAAALLRFNFNYGDLIRWLKGPYTYNHRNWTALQDCIKVIEQLPPPPGWPKVNLPRAMKVLQQGCPLAGHCHCSFDSVL